MCPDSSAVPRAVFAESEVDSDAIAVVVTGTPIESARLRRGGFAALLRDELGAARPAFVELDATAAPLRDLRGFRAVLVTGSAASVVERAPWMLSTEARLRDAVQAGTPVLGICFGHQLLGQALGGRVAKNPRGREIGTVRLELLRQDPLLDRAHDPFLVNMTHLDSVLELPPGAEVLARSALDPHAAVRFGPRAWGVQFHPEIDAEVMADYVRGRWDAIVSEGLDGEGIRAGIAEAPGGRAVLGHFLSAVGVAGGAAGS
jgi:GMP synthase (glutamine-hydrolysing)